MTKLNVNKPSYIFPPIVQNKVQWGGVLYLLINSKEGNFLHEING